MSTEIARLDRQDIALQDAWAPAVLEQQVALEKQRRSIMVDYFRSCMQEGHHFYRLPGQEDRKPALSKEGALNICSLYKVVAVPDDPVETWHSDGHYTVRYRTRILYIANGQLVAVGDGMCSTRESKYAYRYASQVCPHCGKAAIIKGREEFGGGWLCFRKKDGCGAKFADGDQQIESQAIGRVPNEDIADQCNTVLKIAEKRSLVDAGLKLPLVSELFTQDLEEQISVVPRKIEGPAIIESEPPQRVQKPTQEPSREPIRTGKPESHGPKPTAKEVDELLSFLGACYESDERAWTKVREVMKIPAGQEFTRARVRLQLTRAQHEQLKADAESQLSDDINGTNPEADVPDFSGPDPSQEPDTGANVHGEGSGGSDGDAFNSEATSVVGDHDEQESPIDHPHGANPVITPSRGPTAGGTDDSKYATAEQMADLKDLAHDIGADAEADLQDMLDHHPKGVTQDLYKTVRNRLLDRQASAQKLGKA